MMALAVSIISTTAMVLVNSHTFIRVSVSENFSSKVSSFSTTNRNLFLRLLSLRVFMRSAIFLSQRDGGTGDEGKCNPGLSSNVSYLVSIVRFFGQNKINLFFYSYCSGRSAVLGSDHH